MDFQLDIGELTNTINEYENFIKILSEQKENINKAVKELTDLGWSGEAKDKFLENHQRKEAEYTKLEEDIKYMKSALENDEKPKAVQLKKRSEDFENCIKRSGGAALTSDDMGVISLQYGGQFPINNNVNECTNDYYRRMNSKFEEILNLANSLTFTSFPVTGDVFNLENSLRDQTASLTEFDNSFNVYCSGVRAMEDNICSVFGKISGITEEISKFRDVSIISENGQVDKNEVRQLMLKNPNDLTNEEKELLSYVEKVLGKDEYIELKKLAMKKNDDSSFWEPVWDFEEGVDNFLAQHFNNPFGKFMSRISVLSGNIVTGGNGSKEVFDTGSPAANKIADIIGVCGGVLFNPEDGLEGSIGMVNGVKGFQGFLARKIENIGCKAKYSFEDMGQYIRSVLYEQHQFALPNGGKINTSEDLFKFAKGEGNIAKGVGKAVNKTNKNFWKSYDKLSKDLQKQADEAFKLFKKNPNHPGLNFEQLLGGKYYSVRINGKYRAYGRKLADGGIEWIEINGHDYNKAIRMLENTK
ncbi:hypothetical protein [Clostridium tetanomorphum]|uniref:Uncharacterized protein n=1 Tax=Clostridium tetanomorphum TaxID=1553 RepID=A0A923J2J2_CLOTT|nr:hypothetical protein [Clostridium tetanomorphum]MBC2398770.1 hypothetical protein [Clostridium tetanomorphum]NRZ96865.1 uncharacterized protein YukE [Clostridium tetanomorphum]